MDGQDGQDRRDPILSILIIHVKTRLCPIQGKHLPQFLQSLYRRFCMSRDSHGATGN